MRFQTITAATAPQVIAELNLRLEELTIQEQMGMRVSTKERRRLQQIRNEAHDVLNRANGRGRYAH